MHPPLDRPHPECEDVIAAYKKCHRTHSKFLFWKCDEAKRELDRCFKKEKENRVNEMMKESEELRKEEEKFMGQSMSLDEYIKLEQEKWKQKEQQQKK